MPFNSRNKGSKCDGRRGERATSARPYFKELGARYHRMKKHGVIIMDWSENYFNGIGDEMQHYQEMVAIGLGTGQGLTLVHFSAQPEPFLTQNTP